MRIKPPLPLTALALSLLLSGCGADKNPVVGAYQALIKSGNTEPRYVGVMVIQNDRIWADGEAVEVSAWKFDEAKAVATSANGDAIMTFQVNEDDHQLVQKSPNGDELILRKLFF